MAIFVIPIRIINLHMTGLPLHLSKRISFLLFSPFKISAYLFPAPPPSIIKFKCSLLDIVNKSTQVKIIIQSRKISSLFYFPIARLKLLAFFYYFLTFNIFILLSSFPSLDIIPTTSTGLETVL